MIRPDRSEHGASAILVALSLILLMGFAAIAIDSGAALSERRELQGAVDAGALSAGLGTRFDQTQTGCASTGDLRRVAGCNGAMVAFDIVNSSLDQNFALSQFADATRCTTAAFGSSQYNPDINANSVWNAGIDAVVPITTSGEVLHCIRFTPRMDKVRIILPIEDVQTTFGRVIGRNIIEVSAVAEAELSYQRPGQVIPFVVGPTAAGSSHSCVFEPSAGTGVPPCDGPDNGNFGYMGPQLYGDPDFNTPTICDNASAANRIAASFAKGSDHFYAITTSVVGTANDQVHCPNKNQPIDNVDVQTGGSNVAFTAGAFGGIWGTEGRLLCKQGNGSDPGADEPAWYDLDSEYCVNVSSTRFPEFLDDTPIWEYLNTSVSTSDLSIPSLCTAAANHNVADFPACLDDWKAFPGLDGLAGTDDDHPTEILFTKDISQSPRFAWVPLLNIDPFSGGSGFYDIVDFVPIYIQTMHWKCTGGVCDVMFNPGGDPANSGWPFTQNKSFDGMTAFILDRDMLHPDIRDFPNHDGQLTYNLSG